MGKKHSFYSCAYFIANNNVGIDFGDSFVDDESLNITRNRIEAFWGQMNRCGNVTTNNLQGVLRKI